MKVKLPRLSLLHTLVKEGRGEEVQPAMGVQAIAIASLSSIHLVEAREKGVSRRRK
jgi:hypothetical protein